MIYSDEKGDQLSKKQGAPEVLCGKEKCTEDVAEAQN
jgi:hypothetical protein